MKIATFVLGVAWAIGAAAAESSQPLNADAALRFPAPGRMVDIGGRRLHLLCKGPEKGPTVILETGAMASSVFYWKAQDEVAAIAHVCTYDRAGLGWSDPAPMPRSLEARADDLHALLEKSGIKSPYILAAHSAGGLIALIFNRKYPGLLAGMVLLESSEEQSFSTDKAKADVLAGVKQAEAAADNAARGIDMPQLRVPGWFAQQDIAFRESVFRTAADDLLAMSQVREQVQRLGGLGNLGDLPLVVVYRASRDEQGLAAQERLAKLSTRSVKIVAQKSGHNIMFDEPHLYSESVGQLLQMTGPPKK